MLALKEPLLSADPNQFLGDPIKQTLSPKGYRFSSLANCLCYQLAGKLTGRDCAAFAMSSSPVKMK